MLIQSDQLKLTESCMHASKQEEQQAWDTEDKERQCRKQLVFVIVGYTMDLS